MALAVEAVSSLAQPATAATPESTEHAQDAAAPHAPGQPSPLQGAEVVLEAEVVLVHLVARVGVVCGHRLLLEGLRNVRMGAGGLPLAPIAPGPSVRPLCAGWASDLTLDLTSDQA